MKIIRHKLCHFVCVLLVTLLLVCAQAAAQESSNEGAQGQDAAAARKVRASGQSTIRGRVLFDDTGRPVRRAVVMLLTNLNYPAVRRTVTNRRGEFRFGSLAAGNYFVVADVPGTVSLSSGFRISELGLTSEGLDEEQTAVAVDGKREAQTEVRVRRGGALSGKATYSDNEPVLSGRVLLFRRTGSNSVRFFTDPVLTDDRGMYRFEGLPPGDYVVGIVEKDGGDDKFTVGERPALVAAYYPSAKGLQEAKVVQVTAGSETKEVDIRLAEDALRRISGEVVWRSTGQAAQGATVMLQRRGDPSIDVSLLDLLQSTTAPGSDKTDNVMRDMSLMMMLMSTTPVAPVNVQGRWTFEDLPSGTYTLTAVAPLPQKEGEANGQEAQQSEVDKRVAEANLPLVVRRFEVTVGDNDEADIKLELSEGGRVSGLLTTDEGPLPYVRLMLDYEGALPVLNLPYEPNPDGTFLLEGVPPGEVRLDVRLPPGSDYYVKSMTGGGGADLLRAPLRVAEGTELSGLRITLAKGRATLSGRVTTTERGKPAGGAAVLLMPVDERLWPVRGFRAFARTDAEGAYSLPCAPGDYLIIAWNPKDEPAQSVEALIRARLATAPRISLQSKESRKLDLTVNQRER